MQEAEDMRRHASFRAERALWAAGPNPNNQTDEELTPHEVAVPSDEDASDDEYEEKTI